MFEEVVSAYRDRRRPERDRLEAALTDGDIKALYVRDLDRLARRLMDTARIVDTCDRHDVTIYTTSKRLRRTAENLRQKGGWNGPAPYGWVRPEQRNADGVKTLRLHPQESRVVRRIVDWRLEGLSVSEIVRQLMEAGITNREGRPFQYRAVATLLRHPLLAGFHSVTAKATARTGGGGPDIRDTREIVINKDGGRSGATRRSAPTRSGTRCDCS